MEAYVFDLRLSRATKENCQHHYSCESETENSSLIQINKIKVSM
jgi:hypothetical protein